MKEFYIERVGRLEKKFKKWIPTVVVFLLSLTVLFGVYFIYEKLQIKEPMIDAINQIKGVQVENINIENDKIQLEITLQEIDNFQETYHAIVDATAAYKGDRVIDFQFSSIEDEQILRAWNSSYFYIAEAIAKHDYSMIPDTITQIKKQLLLDKTNYSMDDKNIYIDLHKGEKSQYFILKREQEVGDLG